MPAQFPRSPLHFVVAFDGEGLLRGIGNGEVAGDKAIAHAWYALMQTNAASACELLCTDVVATQEKTQVEALMALALMEQGLPEQALQHARLAHHGAQVQGATNPLDRVLAALVLARLRRLMGRPHLALQILTSVNGLVPSQWQPWMAWETLLAGGQFPSPLASVPGDAPARRAAGALAAVMESASRGDQERFASEGRILAESSQGFGMFLREGEAFRSCVDAEGEPSPSVAKWCAGEDENTPHALYGAAHTVDRTPVFVYAAPGKKPRRLLAVGRGLVGEARVIAYAEGESGGVGGRTATALAVAALSGGLGLRREDFFKLVYGFAFKTEKHRGVLETLVHRMRIALGDVGDVERIDGRIALNLAKPILLADPRCTLPLSDMVLRTIVELGMPSAVTAANALGLPLRTVQAALAQLVEEGTCQAQRDGRSVVYRVEDTTFGRPKPSAQTP